MNVSRVACGVLALTALSFSGQAQTGCKPNDPSGYFEGTATSQQAGKLDVSLNLRCDQGRYGGELITPSGTYTVKDGHFESGHLHLNLESGASSITVEADIDAASVHGRFTAADDSGPVELRRTGDQSPARPEGLSLSKEQWRQDLEFLARELPKRHANAFHFISHERFEQEVSDLNNKLDTLNSDEIYAGMDRIANLIGDGHTYVRTPEDNANFPIDLERFGDEYRVAGTASGNEKALGARVIKIQDMSITRAHELLYALTPADETQALRDLRVLGFLTTGIFLHGVGIIPERNVARYTLRDDNGREFTMDVHAVPASAKLDWTFAFKERPLFRQRPGENFWYTYLPDSHTVYCSFRGYKGLSQNSKGLFELIQQQHPDKLVIDMRLNGGGDYFEGLKYLVHPIRDIADINRKGHLFVLVGPETFSAAMSNAAHFRYQTNAVLVGQQIGEKPNSYQEAREMKLPNSHWTVRYSVKFYKFVETRENLIRPDQEIIPSWDDYRSGRDPVLEWVLKQPPQAAHGAALPDALTRRISLP
jgi:C-terminal processing protease CtpA/Prc